MNNTSGKEKFASALEDFVESLSDYVSTEDGQWTIKGFIDIFKNIYTISEVGSLLWTSQRQKLRWTVSLVMPPI